MWWRLMKEMDFLRKEIDRMFDSFGKWDSSFPRVAFLPGRSARLYPLINLSSNENAFYVEALAPGIDPENLNVTVVHNTLTISGEKKPINPDIQPEAFHRSERSAGKFLRTVELPEEVDASKVKADYKNGILSITLPKTAQVKPKQIKVKVA